MSSSISSSEHHAFAAAFVAASAALFGLLLGAALALDPYDTGRLALVARPGVQDQGPRTANASRGRDPAFDGAILGNSHLQMVSPGQLSDATGIAFVSLTVPGASPKEQLVLLDYFVGHRARPAGALVLGIDDEWCRPRADVADGQPFPFWLYGRSDLAYAAGLVRYPTLEAGLQRLLVLAGLSRRPQARRDGYWDYEANYLALSETAQARMDTASTIPNETGRFPRIEALGARLAALPDTTAIVAVRPPVLASALPRPGTPAALSDAACRAALEAILPGRRAALVDWRVDRPELRPREHFFDSSHYRRPVARALERDIAAALNELRARR